VLKHLHFSPQNRLQLNCERECHSSSAMRLLTIDSGILWKICRRKSKVWLGNFAFPVDKDLGWISLSNIPGVANVRVCPTTYSDWIYRVLQMSGFVQLGTVTEYTGCCKCQCLSNCVQWLNIPGVANVSVCPTVYSDCK